jgi:hypothetical protein
MAIGFGNINGAVTANIVSLQYTTTNHLVDLLQYRAADRPWYRLGHGIVLAYIAIGFFCSILFGVLLKRENARRDRGERDEVIEGIDNKHANEKNGRYENVTAARIDKGDEWSGFRYTL